jgi:alpha-galactosidase
MRQALLLLIVSAFLTLSGLPAAQNATASQMADTPPMGWNSWDSYGLTIQEPEYKTNVDWMAAHLKQYGWSYAVIDEGWYLQNPENAGKPGARFTLDAEGRYAPAPNRFPSASGDKGFRPLADYVHSLGLKFGIHIIRGISREAVARSLPIADSSYQAADAADVSDTCSWNADNYGVKENAAGQAYYDSLAKLYAGWGVDFVKVDCISSRPYQSAEIHMISAARKKTGRSIVLSLSPGPTSLAVAEDVRQYAQMWRISDDLWDYWKPSPDQSWTQTLYGQFATAVAWAPFIEPGHFPDADMLPIGYLGPRPGLGTARQTHFTHDEQRTLITFWSIFRSPLMIGGDLPHNDPWTTSLLTNQEILAVNQHSTGNRPLIMTNSLVIWSAKPDNSQGHYLAIFNRGDAKLDIALRWNELGLISDRAYNLRDLWEHKDLGAATSLKLTLQPHSCAMYRATE